MAALFLDAGALVAVERGDAAMLRRLQRAARLGDPVRTAAPVVGQVWRGGTGRQALLARMLSGVAVLPVDHADCRRAGVLLGRAGTADVVDALVVLLAADRNDRVLTGDLSDLRRLAEADGRPLVLTPV